MSFILFQKPTFLYFLINLFDHTVHIFVLIIYSYTVFFYSNKRKNFLKKLVHYLLYTTKSYRFMRYVKSAFMLLSKQKINNVSSSKLKTTINSFHSCSGKMINDAFYLRNSTVINIFWNIDTLVLLI